MQALAGPAGPGGAVVGVWRRAAGRAAAVWRGRGRAVAVGDPARVLRRGGRGPVAGSPGGAGVGVAVCQALLVGGRLVVALVLVVPLVEGPVAVRPVARRRPAPAAAVRRAWRAVAGGRAAMVRRGAGGRVAGRRPVVVGALVVGR